MSIRFAAPADSADLLRIYAQYIQTPVTFEYPLPTEEEFAARVAAVSRDYPYLVWEEAGRIVGYAYARRLGERAAYQWSAELSVYLDRDHTGRGLGRRLYAVLMALLRLQGVRTVYGVVTLPNPGSEGLHRGMGFHLAGTHHRAGYKNGAWRDVGWFEKAIAPYDPEPAPFRPISAFPPAALERAIRQKEDSL